MESKKKISVFGLGYVGTVSAVCFGSLGHDVIGVDSNDFKVKQVNLGLSPIVEKGLGEMLAQQVAEGKLTASLDVKAAIRDSDISFIAVGTPSNGDGSLDLSYVQAVLKDIAIELKSKATRHVIVIRSTVLPNSAADTLIPIIEQYSGMEVDTGFGYVFNPEFLRESSAIADFFDPPKSVVGSGNPSDTKLIASLYDFSSAPLFECAIVIAEMVKYADNAFHATKVVFGNEIGSISKSLGIDSHEVMDIFCADKKLNISSYYLKPGFAFGGSCLPKDLRALTSLAANENVKVPLLASLIDSNNTHIDRAFSLIESCQKESIGFLGFAFKSGTDDMRESPIIDLIEKCIVAGMNVTIFDQNVRAEKVTGVNKQMLLSGSVNFSELIATSPSDLIAKSDVIVVGNNDQSFPSLLLGASREKTVIDLVRLPMETKLDSKYIGLCW